MNYGCNFVVWSVERSRGVRKDCRVLNNKKLKLMKIKDETNKYGKFSSLLKQRASSIKDGLLLINYSP